MPNHVADSAIPSAQALLPRMKSTRNSCLVTIPFPQITWPDFLASLSGSVTLTAHLGSSWVAYAFMTLFMRQKSHLNQRSRSDERLESCQQKTRQGTMIVRASKSKEQEHRWKIIRLSGRKIRSRVFIARPQTEVKRRSMSSSLAASSTKPCAS